MVRPILALIAIALLALTASTLVLGVPPTLSGDQRIELVLSLVGEVGMIALAAMLGARLAPRMGLRSHIAGLADRLRGREVGEALLVGVAIGIVIVAVGAALTALGSTPTRVVSPNHAVRMQLAEVINSVSGELIFRWGVMTFVATAITTARGSLGPAHRRDLVLAALIAACVEVLWARRPFGEGTGQMVSHIVVAAAQGVGCGWMYARWSLEAAMIAHAVPQALMTAAVAGGMLAAQAHG